MHLYLNQVNRFTYVILRQSSCQSVGFSSPKLSQSPAHKFLRNAQKIHLIHSNSDMDLWLIKLYSASQNARPRGASQTRSRSPFDQYQHRTPGQISTSTNSDFAFTNQPHFEQHALQPTGFVHSAGPSSNVLRPTQWHEEYT